MFARKTTVTALAATFVVAIMVFSAFVPMVNSSNKDSQASDVPAVLGDDEDVLTAQDLLDSVDLKQLVSSAFEGTGLEKYLDSIDYDAVKQAIANSGATGSNLQEVIGAIDWSAILNQVLFGEDGTFDSFLKSITLADVIKGADLTSLIEEYAADSGLDADKLLEVASGISLYDLVNNFDIGDIANSIDLDNVLSGVTVESDDDGNVTVTIDQLTFGDAPVKRVYAENVKITFPTNNDAGKEHIFAIHAENLAIGTLDNSFDLKKTKVDAESTLNIKFVNKEDTYTFDIATDGDSSQYSLVIGSLETASPLGDVKITDLEISNTDTDGKVKISVGECMVGETDFTEAINKILAKEDIDEEYNLYSKTFKGITLNDVVVKFFSDGSEVKIALTVGSIVVDEDDMKVVDGLNVVLGFTSYVDLRITADSITPLYEVDDVDGVKTVQSSVTFNGILMRAAIGGGVAGVQAEYTSLDVVTKSGKISIEYPWGLMFDVNEYSDYTAFEAGFVNKLSEDYNAYTFYVLDLYTDGTCANCLSFVIENQLKKEGTFSLGASVMLKDEKAICFIQADGEMGINSVSIDADGFGIVATRTSAAEASDDAWSFEHYGEIKATVETSDCTVSLGADCTVESPVVSGVCTAKLEESGSDATLTVSGSVVFSGESIVMTIKADDGTVGKVSIDFDYDFTNQSFTIRDFTADDVKFEGDGFAVLIDADSAEGKITEFAFQLIKNETEEVVTVDGIDYPVVDGNVTIGISEYPVNDGKISVDVEYEVEDGKVTVDGVEYSVVDGNVTIDGSEYPVNDGMIVIETEYSVEDKVISIYTFDLSYDGCWDAKYKMEYDIEYDDEGAIASEHYRSIELDEKTRTATFKADLIQFTSVDMEADARNTLEFHNVEVKIAENEDSSYAFSFDAEKVIMQGGSDREIDTASVGFVIGADSVCKATFNADKVISYSGTVNDQELDGVASVLTVDAGKFTFLKDLTGEEDTSEVAQKILNAVEEAITFSLDIDAAVSDKGTSGEMTVEGISILVDPDSSDAVFTFSVDMCDYDCADNYGYSCISTIGSNGVYQITAISVGSTDMSLDDGCELYFNEDGFCDKDGDACEYDHFITDGGELFAIDKLEISEETYDDGVKTLFGTIDVLSYARYEVTTDGNVTIDETKMTVSEAKALKTWKQEGSSSTGYEYTVSKVMHIGDYIYVCFSANNMVYIDSFVLSIGDDGLELGGIIESENLDVSSKILIGDSVEMVSIGYEHSKIDATNGDVVASYLQARDKSDSSENTCSALKVQADYEDAKLTAGGSFESLASGEEVLSVSVNGLSLDLTGQEFEIQDIGVSFMDLDTVENLYVDVKLAEDAKEFTLKFDNVNVNVGDNQFSASTVAVTYNADGGFGFKADSLSINMEDDIAVGDLSGSFKLDFEFKGVDNKGKLDLYITKNDVYKVEDFSEGYVLVNNVMCIVDADGKVSFNGNLYDVVDGKVTVPGKQIVKIESTFLDESIKGDLVLDFDDIAFSVKEFEIQAGISEGKTIVDMDYDVISINDDVLKIVGSDEEREFHAEYSEGMCSCVCQAGSFTYDEEECATGLKIAVSNDSFSLHVDKVDFGAESDNHVFADDFTVTYSTAEGFAFQGKAEALGVCEIVYGKDGQAFILTVESSIATSPEFHAGVTVTVVDATAYEVKDGKVTVDGTDYTVTDGEVEIDKIPYKVEDDRILIEGDDGAVVTLSTDGEVCSADIIFHKDGTYVSLMCLTVSETSESGVTTVAVGANSFEIRDDDGNYLTVTKPVLTRTVTEAEGEVSEDETFAFEEFNLFVNGDVTNIDVKAVYDAANKVYDVTADAAASTKFDLGGMDCELKVEGFALAAKVGEHSALVSELKVGTFSFSAENKDAERYAGVTVSGFSFVGTVPMDMSGILDMSGKAECKAVDVKVKDNGYSLDISDKDSSCEILTNSGIPSGLSTVHNISIELTDPTNATGHATAYTESQLTITLNTGATSATSILDLLGISYKVKFNELSYTSSDKTAMAFKGLEAKLLEDGREGICITAESFTYNDSDGVGEMTVSGIDVDVYGEDKFVTVSFESDEVIIDNGKIAAVFDGFSYDHVNDVTSDTLTVSDADSVKLVFTGVALHSIDEGLLFEAESFSGTDGADAIEEIALSETGFPESYASGLFAFTGDGAKVYNVDEEQTLPESYYFAVNVASAEASYLDATVTAPAGSVFLLPEGVYKTTAAEVDSLVSEKTAPLTSDGMKIVEVSTTEDLEIDISDSAEISGKAVDMLDDNQTVVIKTDSGSSIKMPASALKLIAGGDDQTVSIKTVKVSDSEQENKIVSGFSVKDKAKLDSGSYIAVSIPNAAQLKELGEVTVTLPFELNGMDPSNLRVYYFNDETLDTEEIECTYFEDEDGNGYISFVTTHFSGYIVCQALGGNTDPLLYIAAIALGLLITAFVSIAVCRRNQKFE